MYIICMYVCTHVCRYVFMYGMHSMCIYAGFYLGGGGAFAPPRKIG